MWSNEISDLFGTLQGEGKKWSVWLDNPELLDELTAKYQSTSLASGIDKGYEIMIGCKAYYMVNNEHTTALKKYFNIKMGGIYDKTG